MKEGNNGSLVILIVAVAVVVSASFTNNYFAYFFWAKDNGHAGDINNTIKPAPKPFHPKIDDSWKWNYSEIGTEETNYPIVVLRDGYKAIKLNGDKVLVGWKYELLNTSPIDNYNVSITYQLKDKDDFQISESSASEIVRSGQVSTIQTTTLIPYEDFTRVSGSGWSVHLTPDWTDKKLKGNRFERAGSIFKKNSPYWFKARMQYLFLADFPFGKDAKGLSQVFSPNKWIISEAMGIKPDIKLKEIGNKLNIDFTSYDLPNWNTISSNPNYATLTKEEKQSLKTFLRVQKEYGDYSPTSGRSSNFVWEEDFPDPEKKSGTEQGAAH